MMAAKIKNLWTIRFPFIIIFQNGMIIIKLTSFFAVGPETKRLSRTEGTGLQMVGEHLRLRKFLYFEVIKWLQ
jgi:hypothetical protein